ETTADTGLENRNGKFTTGQEAGVFTRLGHQIGLSQDLQDVLLLQRFNGRGQIDIWAEDEKVEQVTHADVGGDAILGGNKLRRRKLLGRNCSNVLGSGQADPVEAELINDGAADICEMHLQHDLTGRRDGNLHQAGDLRSSVFYHLENLV